MGELGSDTGFMRPICSLGCRHPILRSLRRCNLDCAYGAASLGRLRDLSLYAWDELQWTPGRNTGRTIRAWRGCHGFSKNILAKHQEAVQLIHASVFEGRATCIECSRELDTEVTEQPATLFGRKVLSQSELSQLPSLSADGMAVTAQRVAYLLRIGCVDHVIRLLPGDRPER